MSAAAVVRSVCHHVLRRRPVFPSAVMERQPPRFSQRAENFSVRRFHSSDCTVAKPAAAETNTATAVEEVINLKLDKALSSFDKLTAALVEEALLKAEQEEEEILLARGRKVLGSIVVAGVLAGVYVKRRFFGEAKEEDKAGDLTALPGNN